jgi:hypothetical protein
MRVLAAMPPMGKGESRCSLLVKGQQNYAEQGKIANENCGFPSC